jgi:hypothetical protein
MGIDGYEDGLSICEDEIGKVGALGKGLILVRYAIISDDKLLVYSPIPWIRRRHPMDHHSCWLLSSMRDGG